MNDSDYQAALALADKLFLSGQWPTLQIMSVQLKQSESDLAEVLEDWQRQLPKRAVIANRQPEPTEEFKQALESLWNDAVSTAASQYRQDLEAVSQSHDSAKQSVESANIQLQQQVMDAKAELAQLQDKIGLIQEERSLLAAELAEANKQIDERNKDIAQFKERMDQQANEHQRVQRQLDETRETFEHRLKEEQHHQQDQLAKLENEIRNVRLQSQIRSDEFSKTESALNKQINDLQTELSKRELKIESILGQSRSVESELKKLQSKQGGQQQSMTQMKNQLLAESNKSKRLDEKIDKLTKELGAQQQSGKQAATEAAARESQLRQENQRLQSEINTLNHQLGVFQNKLTTKEDQLKRLKRTSIN